MSDQVASTTTSATEQPKKGTRSRPVKTRKHSMDGVSSRDLATFLDKLHNAGGTLVALNQSLSVGGNYEVVSYVEN